LIKILETIYIDMGSCAPVLHVCMRSGASKKAKNKIIRGITKVSEDLGLPSQAVEIIIIEVPKEN